MRNTEHTDEWSEDATATQSERIYAVLQDAFEASGYLGYAGSGNVQAVEHIVGNLHAGFEDVDDEVGVLAGYLMGAAMLSYDDAYYYAELVFNTSRRFDKEWK